LIEVIIIKLPEALYLIIGKKETGVDNRHLYSAYLLRGLISSARRSKACRRGVVVEAVEDA
jgi:hypothetical protein